MKTTFTSLLVNRLFVSAFTLIFILFAGNANATGDPGTVEYASLAATANNNGVIINWVTVAELNNSHFEVERSTDMKSFKTVAMVLDGFAATGTNGKSYKFKEAVADIKNGKTVYYRLKQIDNDNQVHYSTVMAVQMNTTVTVYPNSQTLLSKQSTSSMGETKMPAVSSADLSAGILNACEIILGSELYAPKLCAA
ncbi:MAG: hypothetical protein JNM14_14540 [Ferruginibacter sp.]|nr:hypothetical protein [Ferruginibacter sp.]